MRWRYARARCATTLGVVDSRLYDVQDARGCWLLFLWPSRIRLQLVHLQVVLDCITSVVIGKNRQNTCLY